MMTRVLSCPFNNLKGCRVVPDWGGPFQTRGAPYAGGRFDPTLSAEDLLVREDGEAQRVTGVFRLPAHVLLLADTGGEQNPLKTARLTAGVAEGLVTALRPGDSVALLQVSNRAELIQG